MSWASDADATWSALVEGLVTHGFELDAKGLPYGEVAYTTTDGELRFAQVEVHRGVGYPFRPPRVRPWDGSGTRSWHQEPDGTLCLYGNEGNADWPWLDTATLIARIAEWFTLDAAGWPGVPPDLDLERHLDPSPFPAMILYRDIDALVGKAVRLRRRGHDDVYEVAGTGTRPKGKSRRNGPLYGLVVDVGVLDRPFHTWPELAELLGGTANRLEKQIRAGHVQVLVVRYQRGEYVAVAALTSLVQRGEIELRAVESADDGPSTRLLRVSEVMPFLRDKKVALVGAGAVGGFVGDLIVRDGVRHLTVVDGERLRPGNCIRHTLDHRCVGRHKASALREELLQRHDLKAANVTAVDKPLADGEDAERLLAEHDLVINATASDLATGLLHHCADGANTPVLSVHLERDGGLAVVHRRPLESGHANVDLAPDPRPRVEPLLEGGCGDPVARTAPDAVLAAASLCARLAVDALRAGAQTLPVTVVQVLVAQPDPPFTEVATLVW